MCYPHMQNTLLKQILWQQSTLRKQILWQLRFPRYWEISKLVMEGSRNYTEYLGPYGEEGNAFVSSSLTFWYFSSYNKSAGSNTQERQTDLLVQVEAIVPLTRPPACCNNFFQTLWSAEADFIGLSCLVLWITNQLRAAIPTSTWGAHAGKTKPRICSKKSFPAQQVLAIPKRKPKNSS